MRNRNMTLKQVILGVNSKELGFATNGPYSFTRWFTGPWKLKINSPDGSNAYIFLDKVKLMKGSSSFSLSGVATGTAQLPLGGWSDSAN